jgi:hypothetical protein
MSRSHHGPLLRLRSCAHGLYVGRVGRRSAPWVGGPVTARAASAVAAERATVGRRLLIGFYSVAMLILLRGVAA